MITPIRALNIREVCGRMNDLLVSADDIKELAKNEREKAISEFAEQIKAEIANCSWQFSRLEAETIDNMAKEMKGE